MMDPHEVFDHRLLIERNIPQLVEWLEGIHEILTADHDASDAIATEIVTRSSAHGIVLRISGKQSTKRFYLGEHSLTKEIFSFDPARRDTCLIIAREIERNIDAMRQSDAVEVLRGSGYAEQAFCTEMHAWSGRRVVAYERLALNLLSHVHPDDLERAIDEEYVPQVREHYMQDPEDVRLNDRLARRLEEGPMELAGRMASDHPDGALTIRKRLGMVHVGPYNVEGVMFLGELVCLPHPKPETILTALAGRPLSRVLEMPVPFEGISVESARNKDAGVEIVTDGYVEGIAKARSFEMEEK